MIRQAAIAAAILTTVLNLPGFAQSAGTQGSGGRETSSTGSQGMMPDQSRIITGPQNETRPNMGFRSGPGFNLPPTGMGIGSGLQGMARIRGPRGRNGLPPTRLDSFVKESGGHAWHIYGDEGTYSIPPFFEFTPVHRIERGITGGRAAGLTTSHGSALPPAWGGDEFVDTEGFTQSGASYQQIPPMFNLSPPDRGLGVNTTGGNSNFNFNVNGAPVNGNVNGGGFSVSVNTGLGTFGGTYNPGTGQGSVRVPGGRTFDWP